MRAFLHCLAWYVCKYVAMAVATLTPMVSSATWNLFFDSVFSPFLFFFLWRTYSNVHRMYFPFRTSSQGRTYPPPTHPAPTLPPYPHLSLLTPHPHPSLHPTPPFTLLPSPPQHRSFSNKERVIDIRKSRAAKKKKCGCFQLTDTCA